MKSYSTSVLVTWCALAVLLGSHTCHAQNCSVATGFVCVSPTQYVACVASKAVITDDPFLCNVGYLCYGSSANVADICKITPCSDNGNFPFPGGPESVYYTCYNKTEISVSTCPVGLKFDSNTKSCATSAPSTAPNCTGFIQFLTDPNSCNHYYLCGLTKDEPATRTRCPALISRFDSTLRVCRNKYFTTCGLRKDFENE